MPGAQHAALTENHGQALADYGRRGAILFEEDFARDLARGRVIGSEVRLGVRRRGIDLERVLEIRDGALRIHPLMKPGWSRVALSYGTYRRRNGLGFAVHVLNGDNGSVPYRLKSLSRRVARWLLGSGTDPLVVRILRFPFRLKREATWRRLSRWAQATRAGDPMNDFGGNLAVGWFPEALPRDPTGCGNPWIVRGAGGDGGHLRCRASGSAYCAADRLANLPMHYIVLLRKVGAAYYLASVRDVPVAGAFPYMRPIAVDATEDSPFVHPEFHQSAVGEAGFGIETVLYGAKIADVPELAEWYGTAHAADRLTSGGLLSTRPADTGGRWVCVQGDFLRTTHGASPTAARCFALLRPERPSGLLHAIVHPRGFGSDICLVWRALDEANHWRLRFDHRGCHVEALMNGVVRTCRSDAWGALKPGRRVAVQIADDGARISIALDGTHRPALSVLDASHASATGVGLATVIGAPNLFVTNLEAHPREIEIPLELRLKGAWAEQGTEVVVHDSFGARRSELAGHTSPGGFVWKKLMGRECFALNGDGVEVIASSASPIRSRVAYGIEWPDSAFADITARILPPRSVAGEAQNGRGGLFFWQDKSNYIVVNTWLDNTNHEYRKCGAASSFFYLRGFDDVYDAVWTNLADRIRPGEACDLRLIFDGRRYCVHVNGEPVLYRALDDIYPRFGGLRIRYVGIIANWEWGHDTGSRFLSFTARRRRT
jgi:hypothetical protein